MSNTIVAQTTAIQLSGGVSINDRDESMPHILGSNETVDNAINKNIFAKVEVSKQQCVEGEPILVTYKLFTRLKSESKVVKQPEFSGCSVIEMTTDNLPQERVMLNGKLFKSYIVRKVQIIPLQSGKLVLDNILIDNLVSFYKTIEAAKYDRPDVTKKVTLSSQPLTINIKDLPTKKPINFSNAIGKFSIKAQVLKHNDSVNGNNLLSIEIGGKGNFQNIICPIVHWPSGIDSFELQTSDSIDRLSFPMSGKRTFSIPFVCKKMGQCTIAPIDFVYFDTDLQQYQTIKSDSIVLNISPEVKGIDTSQLSTDVTNKKYIWLVPFIALIAGISLWLKFKNPTPINASSPEIIQTNSEVVINEKVDEDYHEQLNQILLTETDSLFYEKIKLLCNQLLNNTRYTNNETLTNIVHQCNEALYANVSNTSKDEILRKIELIISSTN